MGRVISLTLPDTTVKYTSYYPTGQVKAEWGSQTNPTFRIYNQQNQLIELRTYKNQTTEPDANTQNFAKTNWNYSNKGLLANKRDHSGKGPDYTYSAAGRLKTVAQARTLPGVTTRITKTINYTQGMQTSITYNVGGTPNVTTVYDVLGRVKTITQTNQSKLEYTYTGLNLDTETIRYDGNVDGDFTDSEDLVRTLDRRDLSLGRDKGWELKDGSTVENQVTYDYDTAGRLSTVNNGTNTFTYGYNYSQANATAPRIGDTSGSNQDFMPYNLSINTATALQSIRSFEAKRDVLLSIANKAGSVTRSSYTYTVNAIGQRTDLTTAFDLGSGITSNAGDTDWGYDALGQVTSADAPATLADRVFEYDHIGNRKKSAESLTLPGSDNFVTNALNQYTTVGAFSPGYDDDGNQTIAQIKPITATTAMSSLFAWDGINQLAEVKDDTTTSRVKYRYDALNRRISRVLPDGNITHFVYDGWNCIAEYSASSSAAASLARKRTWGLDLSGQQQGAGGVGGLLSETHGSTPYYPTYDGNGNISEYLNTDGTTAAHFEYDAFGNTVEDNSSLNTESLNLKTALTYRFSTKPIESLTGLYYYGYRWYDPLSGRWPSKDPIEERGGLNLYGFVGNQVIDIVDFLGASWRHRITYMTMEDIYNKYSGALAFTGDPSGGMAKPIMMFPYDDIIESPDRLCAKVVRAVDLFLDVLTVLPTTDHVPYKSSTYTETAMADIRLHEHTRAIVYSWAYSEYIAPISEYGKIATRCGWIKRNSPGEAKKLLSDYLSNNREVGFKEYDVYTVKEQFNIGQDNVAKNWNHLGPNTRTSMKKHYKPNKPVAPRWIDCPDSQ
jgi:RHS repeat-associated protein